MSQLPFVIKCPVPESLSTICPQRQQTTFVTPPSSRMELIRHPSHLTSFLSYPGLAYPYQSREIVTKCHNCSNKCCNQQGGKWSTFWKNELERMNSFSGKPSHLEQAHSSPTHRIFSQETSSMTGEKVLGICFRSRS